MYSNMKNIVNWWTVEQLEWPDNDNGLSTTHIKEFKINDITSSDA